MLRHGFVLVVVSAAFFWACGGKIANSDGSNGGGSGTGNASKPTDGSCPPVGTQYCPSDEPASNDDIDECNKELADPTCGSAYKAFLACAEEHVSCNASGQSDGDAIDVTCQSQLTAYEQCVDQSPTPP